LRLGLLAVSAAVLVAGCGGDEGIKVSGPIASLTSTEVCLVSGGPDAEPGDATCYRIDESSKIARGLGEGGFVTVRASDGVVVELTRVASPE
jgi:hypothetical protein